MQELNYKKKIIVFIVSIVMFMEFLDSSIINTAVPTIAKNFKQDPLLLKFAITSYFLSIAIFTPISGWIADKFGTKKIFLCSVFLFGFSSLLCAISKNTLQLTCFRFLQGIGGAFMGPVSRIVILRIFPATDLLRVQAYIFSPAMLGFVLGPFLGGLFSTYLTWHWIFYVNIPVALFIIYFGFLYIPQQRLEIRKKFDFLGFILSAFSLGCFTFSIDMFGHYEILPKVVVYSLGIIGISLFVILILYCLKKKNPVLDFFILQIKTYRIGVSSSFTMYMLSSSIAFILPLMYQEQFHYSAAYSGILLLPIAFGNFTSRFISRSIINRLGFKISMLTASVFVTLSVILFTCINLNTDIIFICAVEFLFGACIVLHGSSSGALNYVDISKELMSHATALDITSRQFAMSLGIAVSAIFLNLFRKIYNLELWMPQALMLFHHTLFICSVFGILAFYFVSKLHVTDGAHALKN